MATRAQITITIASHDGTPGLLASLKTDGDYSGEAIDNRFYSFAEAAPEGYPEHHFWGEALTAIGRFLLRD